MQRITVIQLLLDEIAPLIKTRMAVRKLIDHRSRLREALLILHLLKVSCKPLLLLLDLLELGVLRLRVVPLLGQPALLR